jgi:hypothetical protein
MGLPADSAIFEKIMGKRLPVEEYILIEKDKGLFVDLVLNTQGLNKKSRVRYVLGDVDKFLTSDLAVISELNVLWLDYCGPITQLRINLINQILDNSPEDITLGLTFLCGRERPDVSQDFHLALDVYMKRIHILTSALESHVSVQCLPYQDKSPMLLFIIKKAKRTTLQVFPVLRS